MAINKEVLDILACPKCRGPVTLDSGGENLICPVCKLAYPIIDDIPNMLMEEARKID